MCDGRTDIRCDETHCDIAGPGAVGDSNNCRVCWLRLGNSGHPRLHSTRCLHLGSATGIVRDCVTCGGGKSIPTYHCGLHGECTPHDGRLLLYKETDDTGVASTIRVPWCRTCKDHVQANHTTGDSQSTEGKTEKATDWPIEGLRRYHHFNGSIAEWRGRTYLCFRRNWDNARLHIAEMSDDLTRVVGFSKELRLGRLAEDAGSQEDPRLWHYKDRLYVSYTGVNWSLYNAVNICTAKLSEELDVESQTYTHYPQRNQWEKNWGFFQHGDDLYAVYHLSPLRILHFRSGTPVLIHEDASTCEKLPFEARGGAPPILHNGELYCFFHYYVRPYEYATGLLTLEGNPPFRLKRWTRELIQVPRDEDHPGGAVAKVVFPGGAIFRENHWFVAYGYYDREVRIVKWGEAYIEGLLGD